MRVSVIWRRTFEILRLHTKAAVLSVLALAMASALLTFALFAWEGLSSLYDRVQNQFAIVAFLKPSASELEVEQSMLIIKAWPEVKDVHYLSAKESLDRFLKDFPEEAELLAELDENPLPAVIEILPRPGISKKEIETIKSRLKTFPWIESSESGEFWVERMQMILLLFRSVGLLLALSIAISVLLIVMNSVKVFLSSFREEFEIMIFVGASVISATFPFVAAGTIIGVLGGALGTVLALAVGYAAPDMMRLSADFAIYSSLGVASSTALLSLVGSIIAVWNVDRR